MRRVHVPKADEGTLVRGALGSMDESTLVQDCPHPVPSPAERERGSDRRAGARQRYLIKARAVSSVGRAGDS
jgi:hypothetical protein